MRSSIFGLVLEALLSFGRTYARFTERRKWLGPTLIAAVAVLYFSPGLVEQRGFGGDFYLHLSLVEAQRRSIVSTGLPTPVVNFDSIGLLAPIPPIAGGISYIVAGYLAAAGLGSYYALLVLCALVLLATMICAYLMCRAFGGTAWVAVVAGIAPAAYAWPVGDLFGRGGAASFIAGMASIAAGCLVLVSVVRPFQLVRAILLLVLVAVALGTHVPSTVIAVFFFAPCLLLLVGLIVRKIGASARRIIFGNVVPVVFGAIAASYALGSAGAWAKLSGQIPRFLATDSARFVSFRNLFSFAREIPESHRRVWESFPGSAAPTLLTVQQPLLFLIPMLAIASVIVVGVSAPRSVRRLVLVLLALTIATAAILMVVDLWSFLPQALQSLQYTFRVLYVLAFLMVVLTAVLLPRLRVWLIVVLSVLVVFEVGRSVVQVYETPNVSLVRDANGAPVWRENVPPQAAIAKWQSGEPWYSALEWVPHDLPVQSPIECRDLSRLRLVAGNAVVHLRGRPGECVSTNVATPVQWLEITGAVARGRTASGGLELELGPRGNAEVSLRRLAPPFIFGGVSAFALVIGLAILASSALVGRGGRAMSRRDEARQ